MRTPSPSVMPIPSVSLRSARHGALYRDDWLTVPPSGNLSPSVKQDKISESKELKKWVDSYLGVGEWVMDQSVAILGSSGFFERKR